MISCPLKHLDDWKDLVTVVGSPKAHGLWNKYKGNVPLSFYNRDSELFGNSKFKESAKRFYNPKEVNYLLKSVNILQSDKAKQIFEKGKKASWDLNKILTELQIPKDQKQLILDLGVTDREQIALELASNYSYSVEINTATDKNRSYYERDGKYYFSDPIDGGIPITKEEYEKQTYNTQHYSNLTVPGGTNGSYIEANIETPMIIPSIQSHAQFKTDNTIGWLRADEKQNYQEEDINNLIKIMEKSGILEINCG